MNVLDRLAHRALDLAARRWPAEIRDEMAREWHAELAAIIDEPRGTRQAIGYAVSLLTAPPVRDVSGAPRGWAETTGTLTPAGAVLLAGLLTLGVAELAAALVRVLFPLLGLGDYRFGPWPSALAGGVLVVLWCLAAGRWLGRRLPIEAGGRLGSATPAGFAPLLLAPALLAPALPDQDPIQIFGYVAGLLIWVPGIALAGVAVARGRFRAGLLLLVAPLVSAVAAVAATLPLALSGPGGLAGGLRVIAASLTGGEPPLAFTTIEEGALSSRSFYHLGPWAVTLLGFAALALAYGVAASRPQEHPEPVTAPQRTPVADDARPVPVTLLTAVGAACVALAVTGWAYTLAVLDPAMPGVSATAPMPGGDGEIYLWVAELRWGAILLAATGMLVAAADRRRAGVATLVFAALLVAADGVLLRTGVTGGGGLRLTLLIGAAAAAATWFTAGGPAPETRQAADSAGAPTGSTRHAVAAHGGHEGEASPGAGTGGAGLLDELVRRRVTAAAVIAACCAPLLLAQGTPGVNHPFLPRGLVLTTTGLAVLGVLLAAIAAVTLSRLRLPWWAALALLTLPAAAVTVSGLLPVPVTSEDTGNALYGAFAGMPLAVLTAALAGWHRGRSIPRTLGMVVAGIPGTVVLWLAAVFFLSIAPNLLFSIEGTGYPADGVSFVPGAALLVVPIAVLVAARRVPRVVAADPAGGSTVEGKPIATV
ncbi:hypothetical protein AMIS_44320 [Actinoplanes missouriensis 431]|uniref:Uncharacterized protein n=1 Tax=Actinoplanes missouriensis (strain ATCC 14538 / DSM 43046 / CBS 188.64 / JCM 3121 / NBRC 102363 / NCIMB 12654 / NRRL B-3342 / UNCC 431) TaxID=512565 RepID=I0H9G5_ACTM4|nr:hypothetical protein [Actinoplanes missouriensis]BAL89652.1 hypothetical protein AMIS_44320 [Actinoplanes missouriensis 431]